MRIAAMVFGVVGGVLLATGAVAALVAGGADTVVIGSWITLAAALLAVGGGLAAGSRPGTAALVMTAAVALAGLVCPGVIPAIADSTMVFLGYLTAGVLILAGALVAWRSRRAVNRPGATATVPAAGKH